MLKQWAKDFDAAHLSVDDCMADSSGWIVVAVLLPIAVAALFVGGFFGAKALKKKRQAGALSNMGHFSAIELFNMNFCNAD